MASRIERLAARNVQNREVLRGDDRLYSAGRNGVYPRDNTPAVVSGHLGRVDRNRQRGRTVTGAPGPLDV